MTLFRSHGWYFGNCMVSDMRCFKKTANKGLLEKSTPSTSGQGLELLNLVLLAMPNLNMSKYRTTNFVFLFWFVMQIKIQTRKILSFFCLVWPPPMFKSLSPLWNEVMKDENAQINDFSNTPDRHISIPTWIEHTLKIVRNDNYTLYKLCLNSRLGHAN